jgi:site-specific DNA recombinase
LRAFDPVWKSTNTNQRTRIVRKLIERVGYDGRTGKVAVTLAAAALGVATGSADLGAPAVPP